MASASDDETVRLWDLVSGKEIRQLAGDLSEATGVAFSPDGRTLVGAGYNTVRLWGVTTGKENSPVDQPRRLRHGRDLQPGRVLVGKCQPR